MKKKAAASARLCVETRSDASNPSNGFAAASARLCVETCTYSFCFNVAKQPPPRGCVLKLIVKAGTGNHVQAAASARLCVETAILTKFERDGSGSRLRAAVC